MELKISSIINKKQSIPRDWQVISFGKISSMKGRIGWQGLNESEFTDNPDEPFLITGMNFKDGKIRWDEVYHVSNERYEIAKEIQLKINDVLITKDGTIGKLLYIDNIPYPGKASLNSHLLVFRPINNQYISKYIFYQLGFSTFSKFIDLEKSGTTFFGITQTAISKYQAILPPLPEQHAIAEALSDIDALITSLDALIAKKRTIKQGVMQELLTGKRRLPGFTKKWKREKVNQFGEIVTGGTPPTQNKDFWEGTIPWITPTDITTEKDVYHSEREITYLGLKSIRKLPPNSILVTCIASIGKNSILRVEGACNQQINAIIPNREHNPDFLYYLFEYNKNFLLGNAGITATLIISKKDFSVLTFLVPEITEQISIASILNDIDFEIISLEQKLNKTKTLKQGMMQELLTGRIRLLGE